MKKLYSIRLDISNLDMPDIRKRKLINECFYLKSFVFKKRIKHVFEKLKKRQNQK